MLHAMPVRKMRIQLMCFSNGCEYMRSTEAYDSRGRKAKRAENNDFKYRTTTVHQRRTAMNVSEAAPSRTAPGDKAQASEDQGAKRAAWDDLSGGSEALESRHNNFPSLMLARAAILDSIWAIRPPGRLATTTRNGNDGGS